MSQAAFTLEVLHIADQEANLSAIKDAPRLSAVMNALEAQDLGGDGLPDNTLRLSSGDAFIAGLFFSTSTAVFGGPGVADIYIQNALGLQAIAIGNHEFAGGTAGLARLIDGTADGGADPLPGLPAFTGTAFPYLSANIQFGGDANLAPLEVPAGSAPLPNSVTASIVLRVNGEKIGVVGATTPTLPIIANSGGLVTLPTDFNSTPTPPQVAALAAEIQNSVDDLLTSHPDMDKVILLAHMQQIAIELQLAELLTDVDIIVAGGSNTRLFDSNDRMRPGDTKQGEYPEFRLDAEGKPVAVVNTDGLYKYVGRLVLDFDADGNIIPASYDPIVSGAYATDAQGVTDLNAESLVDPIVQEVVDLIEASIAATQSNVFAISSVFLNGNRSGNNQEDALDGVRSQETNLGNLIADSALEYAQSLDPTVLVSIRNGGSIRQPIGQQNVPPGGFDVERLPNEEIPGIKPEGGISQTDIQSTLAFGFDRGVSLLTITREELLEVLERTVEDWAQQPGWFPQIAGLKFSFDPDRPNGDRIVSAGVFDGDTLLDVLVENGTLVGDKLAEIRIVTPSFLADGGDGYPFPQDPVRTDRLDTVRPVSDPRTGNATFAPDGSDQDILAEYLFANFGPAGLVTFDKADTSFAFDDRIQNLNFRNDDVLPGGVEITPIFEIQGLSQIAPLVLEASGFATVVELFANLPATGNRMNGGEVTTTGIVTAVGRNLFYLQDATGDGDFRTSDAIVVNTFPGTPTVRVGDAIQVTGTVSEFFSGNFSARNLPTTQINAPTEIITISTGNALPDAVVIGQGGRILPDRNSGDHGFVAYDPEGTGADFWESLEAMRVVAKDLLAVSGTNGFGEIFAVTDRGADATGLSQRGTLNIALNDRNPERVQIDPDATITGFASPNVATGALLGDVTGVLGFGFGNYEIIPTEDFRSGVVASDLQPETTTLKGTDTRLTVANYNVENLDPNDLDGTTDVADGRFEAIARQIVFNMQAPDIIALQEIQDNSGLTDDGVVAADLTLQLLVEAINFIDSSLNYAFVDNTFIGNNLNGGAPNGNIRNAYIYNADRVDLVDGSVQALGGQMPGDTFDRSRLPLVATFEFNGEEVTLVNNHFNSKGGSAPLFGTVQPVDAGLENPNVNARVDVRRAQSAVVNEFVQAELAEDADANIVVLGDLNDFEFVSVVTGLEDGGLTNLLNTLPENERYTFIFQGNSQALDHLLVSENLLPGVMFDAVHINAEFQQGPQFLTNQDDIYDQSESGRASDHDPLMASLLLPGFLVPPGELGFRFSDGRKPLIDPRGVEISREDGELIVANNRAWDAIKVVEEPEAGWSRGIGKNVVVSNFVDANLDFSNAGAANLDLTFYAVKRGEAITANGADRFLIVFHSNAGGPNNTMTVDSGGGNDVVTATTVARSDLGDDLLPDPVNNGRYWNPNYDGRFSVLDVDLGDGNDTVEAFDIRLLANGGAGDDMFVAGIRNDTMTGGSGADEFVIAANGGRDRITDFSSAEGDQILLDGPGALQLLGSRFTFGGTTVIADNNHIWTANDFGLI